jgi:hypothetical protein
LKEDISLTEKVKPIAQLTEKDKPITQSTNGSTTEPSIFFSAAREWMTFLVDKRKLDIRDFVL